MVREVTLEVDVPERVWEQAEERADGTDYTAREFVSDYFYLDFERVCEEPRA